MDSSPADRRTGNPSRRGRLFLVAMAVPTPGSSLGIDGGAIFQILAVGPTAIGVGLALSTIAQTALAIAGRSRPGRWRRL